MSRMNWAQQNIQNKPENVLSQALDLDLVGKSSDAFQLITKSLTFQQRPQKGPQRVWSQPLEDLVIKFVELAVKLKAAPTDVRSVLQNFKSACISAGSTTSVSTNHPQSFIRVMKLLLAGIDKTVNFQHLTIDPEDNEGEDTPEALQRLAFPTSLEEPTLQAQPSAAAAQQHKKNQSSTALRYYWDIYRIAIELVRVRERYSHGSGGQLVYSQAPAFYPLFRELHEEILIKIFQICRTYNLSNDFRRITSRIRQLELGSTKDVRYSSSNTTATELHDQRELYQVAFLSTVYEPPASEFDDGKQLMAQYELILRAKLEQLNTSIALKNWFETVNTFVDINDILSTIRDPRSLATPTVILIQQRFVDFLWAGSNTFLHAFALLSLHTKLTTANQLYGGEQNPQYLDNLLVECRKQAKEMGLGENAWIFADLDTIYSGVILSVILANDTSNNGSSSNSSTATVFGGLYGNVAPTTNDNDEDSNIIKNLELFKYATLLSIEDTSASYSVNNIVACIAQYLKATPQSNDNIIKQTYTLFQHLNNKTLTPLRLRKLLTPFITTLAANQFLQHHMVPLYNTIVRTILLSLAAVYSIITIDKFVSLLPSIPSVDTSSMYQLEGIITKISTEYNLFIKVDHTTRTLYLKPHPQQIEQTVFGTLSTITTQLTQNIVPAINPPENHREALFSAMASQLDNDVKEIRARHIALVNKRKEAEEQKAQEHLRKEAAAKEFEAKQEEEKKAKLEEIIQKREEELKKKAEEDAAAAKKKQITDALQKSVTDASTKDFKLTKDMRKQLSKLMGENKNENDVDSLSEDKLRELMKQLELQKKREYIRLRREGRKLVDYTIRALRLAQREKLILTKETQDAAAKAESEKLLAAEKETHQKKWEHDVAEKKRFAHLMAQRNAYREKVLEGRKAVYAEEMKAWEAEQAHLAVIAKKEQEKREAEAAARRAAELEAQSQKEEDAARQKEEEAKKNKSWREETPDDRNDGFKQQRQRSNKSSSGAGSKFTSGASSGYKFGGTKQQ